VGLRFKAPLFSPIATISASLRDSISSTFSTLLTRPRRKYLDFIHMQFCTIVEKYKKRIAIVCECVNESFRCCRTNCDITKCLFNQIPYHIRLSSLILFSCRFLHLFLQSDCKILADLAEGETR